MTHRKCDTSILNSNALIVTRMLNCLSMTKRCMTIFLFSTWAKYASHSIDFAQNLTFSIQLQYIIIFSFDNKWARWRWIMINNFFFCIWDVRDRARHVRYRMFVRVMKLLKSSISYDFMHIIFKNRTSFKDNKVTINIIVDVLIRQNSLNRCKQNRKRDWSFNTTWHSSITMRFNRSWFSNRLRKQKKSSIKTNSNVININWTSFDELWEFHSQQRMSTFWHFCRKFCRNAIKRTIICVSISFRSQTHVVEFTIVISFALQNVDSMNNKLFSISMNMMINTNFFARMMTSMTTR